MGITSYLTGLALLAASATAQVATYTNDNHGISVNVPSDTASSGSGPIYFQISAPSGTSWVAFGQGTRMAGSNMFVVYARDSTNVTISGRAGTSHSMPEHDSSIQLTLLEGSGIGGDGSLVANVRCENCDSWSGGSMSFTDSSSNWIYASKSGDALDTDDVSARISQHNSDTSFTLDLTSGTGGNSVNPFVAAAEAPTESASASASASAQGSTSESGSTATATQTGSTTRAVSTTSATNAVSNPLASSGSNTNSNSGSSASQEVADPTTTLLNAHGIIMSILFLGCFPLFALTLYLPFAKKVRFIHAPLQALSTILLIVGLALGVVLGNRIGQLDGYHMIIGFIVVAALVLVQPAMGIYQHIHYSRTGGRSAFGVAHRWLGRSMIILGIINGGFGWKIAGNTSAYVPYAVVAVLVFLIYLSVLVFAWYRSSKQPDPEDEKALANRGYEMQKPRELQHQRLPSDPQNAYQQQRLPSHSQNVYQQQQQQQHNQNRQSYTIRAGR